MNLLEFVTKYSCKHLKNNIARIYINNSTKLSVHGYDAGVGLNVEYGHYKISITKSNENPEKTVMGTSRGALIELRSKDVGESFQGIKIVVVSISAQGIEIVAHPSELRQIERIASLKAAIANGKITTASLCHGVGLLAYNLSKGMKRASLSTKIQLANDIDDLALTCSVEGNPIWDDCEPTAVATSIQLQELALQDLKPVNFVEIGLPCQNHSNLCPEDMREFAHPTVGTLFVSAAAVIRKLNPAVFLIENTRHFLNSQTFSILVKEFSDDYNFEVITVKGTDYGDFEPRERACVVAIDNTLPMCALETMTPPLCVQRSPLGTILDEIPLDAPEWREMTHVKRKLNDPRLNFRNTIFTPNDYEIGTLMASYASPKIGAPMIVHPENPRLQRQFSYREHGRIRRAPQRLMDVFERIANGSHSMVTSRGNKSAVHRMCGNSVSPLPWIAVGEWLGNWFHSLFELDRGEQLVA